MVGNIERSELRFRIEMVEAPDWSQVTDNHKANMAEKIRQGGWHGKAGQRYGFVNCQVVADAVYGFFAHEGELKATLYDDEQHEITDENPYFSFEKIVVIFQLDTGLLITQTTKIYKYKDLGIKALRQSLYHLLEQYFREIGLVFSKLQVEEYKQKYSREQLLDIFERHIIYRAKVSNLLGKTVPPDVKLFNPNIDFDAFLKSIVKDDLEHTSHVEWQVPEGLAGGIRPAKYLRALVHAGNPVYLEGVLDDNTPRIWQAEAIEEFRIEVAVQEEALPEEDALRIVAKVQKLYGLASERIREILRKREALYEDLPLFIDQD